jgi:hypothetical protein
MDRLGGFDHLDVIIKNLTITYEERGRISTGHGIRVGNGWKSGSLLIENVRILYAPSYGIGIQNHSENDLAANNITIRDVEIAYAGSDGIDTKHPPDGNTNLHIENVVIRDIGLADERSAAALDISYDHFTIRNAWIAVQACIETSAARERVARECAAARGDPEKTEAERNAVCVQKPISCNVGIRFRERSTASASFGLVEDVYITGASHGIFFEGKSKPNRHIQINRFLIEEFTSSGIYLRGAHNEITNGCAYGPAEPAAVGREIHLGAPLYASSTVDSETVGADASFCPSTLMPQP